jgi:hypothetical protein
MLERNRQIKLKVLPFTDVVMLLGVADDVGESFELVGLVHEVGS